MFFLSSQQQNRIFQFHLYFFSTFGCSKMRTFAVAFFLNGYISFNCTELKQKLRFLYLSLSRTYFSWNWMLHSLFVQRHISCPQSQIVSFIVRFFGSFFSLVFISSTSSQLSFAYELSINRLHLAIMSLISICQCHRIYSFESISIRPDFMQSIHVLRSFCVHCSNFASHIDFSVERRRNADMPNLSLHFKIKKKKKFIVKCNQFDSAT